MQSVLKGQLSVGPFIKWGNYTPNNTTEIQVFFHRRIG